MRRKNWFGLQGNRGGRDRETRRRRQQQRRSLGGTLGEALEPRMLLATTVYLDFGLGFAGGEYPTTVAALRRADGGLDTGPDLVGEGSPTALAAGNDLKFRVLRYNYNNDEKTDNDDVAQLQNAVVPIVKRALSPFDVDVQLARAKDFHDVRKSLDSNNNHANGEFDAYVFLTEVVSSVYGGGSVGAAMGSAGKAAATDGLLGDNRTDEVVVTFADHILATTAGDARKDVFNNKLAYRLAYTAVHEAAHSLGLAHTLGYDGLDPISNQVILTRGDQIRFASDTRETENVFTRFDLALQLTAGLQNSYGKLRDDADIGLGDRDRDGVPDFAYVTGTGAHDRIEIKAAGVDGSGRKLLAVEVKAYRDPARTVLIGELPPSTIVVGADTEGGVRIDSSVGDDEVLIDATLAVDVTVYGGRGNDTIRGGAGADILVGGEGDDTIRGGGGRDGIYGGADHDNLDGGAGDDYLSGDEGNDALAGGSGADVLLGGAGDDVLMGGADADRLHGNDGGDQLDGEGGDDLLSGGSETDRLQGGPGQDELIGGAGVDYLDGGADADRMHDADGTDVIIFDASNFGIFGGLGSGAAIATGSPLASGPIAFGTSALGTTSGLVSAAADSSGSTAVNGPLTGAQAGAIGDGLTWLGSWTAGLGGPLPIGAGAVGSILGDVISRALARPVASYLKGTSGPTIQGVVDVINTLAARVGAPDLAIATRGIRASVAGAEVRFDLQLGVTRSGALRLPDLGADLPGIGTGGAVPLSATVDLDIAFGVDGGGSFFVTLPGHGLALRTQVDATRLDFPIAIGLLAADARDGWIRMDARTTVAVPDADGDGRFAIADLTQVPAGAVTLATAGSLLAELPYAARLGDFADQGVVSIVHPDLSDPAARSVRLDGSEHARGFAAVSTATVVEWLRKATNWLGTVANNPALGGDVPFARGLTWGEVADFASVFRANVLDVLVEEGGMPSFRGAQGLIDKLAAAVGIGPDVLALDYDPLTRELTFRIDASAGVQHDVPLDLGHDFGRLAGVTINEGAQLHLAATITAGLAFGVSLAPRAEPPSGGTTTQQLTAALDRFFLREVALKVDAVATVADIDGTARLGLFNIGLVDGSASARVGVSVTVTDPGRDFRDLVVTPVLSGSAQANLPVRLTADVAGLTFPLDTGLVIAWPDVTRTETLSARLEPAVTLDSLLGSVESVAMGQIIEAVDRAIDFLHGVQERGFFQERLPVVNRSLADLLDTADRLEALKRDLEANPPQTINELIARVRTLFGTAGADAGVGAVAASAGVGAVAAFAAAPVGAAGASGGSPIAFAFNNGVLEVTLNYAIDETRQLNLGFDLDDALNAGILEQFVDVTARAPLTLGIGGAIRVGVAVDVNNPLSPAFYVKDSSQIRLTTLVNAPDIDIQAAVGPLGIFIRDGRVHLDNGTAGQPATWTVGLAPGADGRHALSSLFANLGSLATFAAVGRLEAELPVKFPVEGRGVGSIALGVRDLGHIAGTTALTMPMPDFEGMLAGLDLAGLIGLVVEGLDRSLGAIAERFDDSDLPLIGDDLDKAAGFLDRIREAVIRKLQEAVAFTDDLVTEKIFQAVGPAGLDWLADRNGDGRITADDVAVTFATAGARADVAFRLAGRSAVDRPVDLDLGLPGLGLDVDAALNLAVNFRFDVGFGVSKSEGFYVHTDDFSTPELKVWIEAILSDKTLGAGGALAHPATATAELAFLRFTATDRAITRADGSRSGSYFLGEFTVDLKDPGGDGRLTLAEMASAADITEVIDPRLSATAHVMLGLEAGFGGGAAFPRVGADFELLWRVDTSDPALDGTVQTLKFTDVRINLGDLVTNTIRPVFASIDKILAPIRPLAAALTGPLPVISDLVGSPVTMLDLAEATGQIGPGTRKFLETVGAFAGFVDRIDDLIRGLADPSGGGWVRFGDMAIDGGDARDASKKGHIQPSSIAGAPFSEAKLQGLRDFQDRSGFAVPLLQSPSDLFGLLLGRDILLVTYDTPRLELEFEYNQYFPLIGPLGVTLSGSVGAAADFKFGLDTSGIRQFAAGGFRDPALILNGLYVSDTANADGTGPDVPEFEIFGGIGVFASVNLGAAEFGVGGGIELVVGFNLHDPNADGRLYFQEIVGAFEDLNALARLVDINGRIDGYLRAYVQVLLVRMEFEIGRVTLFEFQAPTAPEPEPVLGTLEATTGTLRLNAGPRAGERLYRGETVDGDERITVQPGANAAEVIVIFRGSSGTYTKTFSGVTHIVVDAGGGNDRIEVGRGVTASVELRGGEGDDVLIAGDGPATLLGGDGDDTLTAGGSAARLEGGLGRDVLTGGPAADVLLGGEGNDVLSGGGGHDQVDGQAGDDAITGGDGADSLLGGDGADTVSGGDGDDFIEGGAGADTLHGEGDRDTISGGRGDDAITGGAQDDTLRGDEDNDTIAGGDGHDAIDGGRGDDRLSGDAGGDTLSGDLGADELFGGSEADVLRGGTGADRLDGGEGNDTLSGDADADILLGQAGDDSLSGGAGDDSLGGGDGVDTLSGDLGNDQLSGGAHNDLLSGGDGNDVLAGDGGLDFLAGDAGNDTLSGGDDPDTLHGGDGHDRLAGDAGNDVLLGQAGNDQLSGGAHNDLLEGGAGDDVLAGDGGVDLLFGDGGNDTLSGGDDPDTLHGGDGHDRLAGDAGNDTLLGQAGNDSLRGGAGDDTLIGDDGDDEISGGSGADVLDGGAGHDALYGFEWYVSGGLKVGSDDGDDGDDVLTGGAGDDTLYGGRGDDVLRGQAGSDRIDGQGGQDRIQYAVDLIDPGAVDELFGGPHRDTIEILGTDAAEALTAQQFGPGAFSVERRDAATDAVLSQFRFSLPADEKDRDIEVLRISGLGGDDAIRAVGTFNVGQLQLDGGAGNDRIEGSAVDDLLLGGVDNDTLLGGAGRDEIHGGDGHDVLDGGDDSDVLYGEDGSDTLRGGAGRDAQRGGPGNDRIEAGDDAYGDLIEGEGGADTLIGGGGIDFLKGGEGDDILVGGDLSDQLLGGSGDDTLVGEAGRDTLDGGDDNDQVFAFVNNEVRARLGLAPVVPRAFTNAEILELYQQIRAELASVEDEWARLVARQIELDAIPAGDRTAEEQDELQAILDRRPRLEDQIAILSRSKDDILVYNSISIDVVSGGDGNDQLYGSPLRDEIDGGRGDDQIYHVAGVNFAAAGDVGDIVRGGEGHDTFFVSGTELADVIRIGLETAGSATPRVFVEVNGQRTRVDGLEVEAAGVLSQGGDDVVTVDFGKYAAKGVEVDGGDGHDRLNAGGDAALGIAAFQGNAVLRGGDGNDTIIGGQGDDRIDGGDGHDSLSGGDGQDLILGGAGNDTISGDAGADSLSGDAGDDVLVGSEGNDLLYGGAGADSLDGGLHNDSLYGGDQNDTLRGADGDDSLAGDAGDDQVFGDAGNDTLSGADGSDRLYGGLGADSLDGGLHNDSLYGGDQNDTLWGSDGEDYLSGDIGDDSLSGGAGNDTLLGADGYDSLAGDAGDDQVFGDAGNDTLSGADGSDRLYGGLGADSLDGGLHNDSLYGGDQNDTLRGADGEDYLSGDAGDDSLSGDAGNDTLWGADGNDRLEGGWGADSLSGGLHNDSLYGGDQNDSLWGEDGNDSLVGDAGDDSLSGDAGFDTLLGADGSDRLYGGLGADSLDGGLHNDSLYGGDQNDTLRGADGEDYLSGDAGDDSLSGDAGNDTLLGADGYDWLFGGAGFDILDGGLHNDSLYGGDQNDSLRGSDGEDYLSGDAGDDTLTGDAGNDTLLGSDGYDWLTGGLGADSLDGGLHNDVLYGGDQNDTLRGADGEDYLSGDAGNDALYGGEGRDTLLGAGGDDYLSGDAGNDLLDGGVNWNSVYDQNTGYDTLEGGTGDDTLYAADYGNNTLRGGDNNDTLLGAGGHDVLDGGSGNDSLSGAGGYDTLFGGDHNDTLDGGAGNDSLDGGQGDDRLYGGADNDTLLGGLGADMLYGDAGNDTLDGGKDGVADVLWGGAGADRFLRELYNVYYYETGPTGKPIRVSETYNRDEPGDYRGYEGDTLG